VGLLALAGAIVPPLLLLRLLVALGRYGKGTFGRALQPFLIGFAAVLPAGLLEAVGALALFVLDLPRAATLLLAALGVGVIEEGVKFWLLRRVIFDRIPIRRVYDALLCAAAAGLGFAMIENRGYLAASSAGESFGLLLAGRVLLAMPAHGLLGVFMGFCLGRARFAASRVDQRALVWIAFLVPALWHGAFDFFAFALTAPSEDESLFVVCALGIGILMVAGWSAGAWAIVSARNDPRRAPDVAIAAVPDRTPMPAPRPWVAPMPGGHCVQCGAPRERRDVLCARCGAAWAPRSLGA
jgi:RsiW-degrading membrane proteinase PrsW (M82 family)